MYAMVHSSYEGETFASRPTVCVQLLGMTSCLFKLGWQRKIPISGKPRDLRATVFFSRPAHVNIFYSAHVSGNYARTRT